MPDPFTIRIVVPDANPAGLRPLCRAARRWPRRFLDI
jgi:hypothetical protein